MGKYTDDEICNAAKITIKIAADYLSFSPNILTLGMRNNLLPIGYAVHNEDRCRTATNRQQSPVLGPVLKHDRKPQLRSSSS